MDDSTDSVFDIGASSDFEPAAKAKAKPATKKAAAAPKAKAAPKKAAQGSLKAPKPKAATKKRPKPDSDDENSDHNASLNDDSLLSNTPPSAKKRKTAPAPKVSSGKPLKPIANESFGLDGADSDAEFQQPAAGKNKTATERYQMLSQLEHILKRPDTYIGSVEWTEAKMWVYNSTTESMELRDIRYVPGLYKIFDEILVNAADNKQNDKNMNEMRVTVNRETGQISVRNNGRGIPIEIHEKVGIYVPEMIFGHLLTSSNYDDDERKVTGGRNGYGAKLCNIYSTSFTIETVDSRIGKKYRQTWTANMSNKGKASITSNKHTDYTEVTFTPDFSKFGMQGIDDDFEALVKRRVYDMAGTVSGIKVYLNGERIKVNSFKRYMEMFTKAIKAEQPGEDGEPPVEGKSVILTDNPHERWEIGFAVSDGSFQQVSFTNSIATTSGGTHVNYIADQIVNKLMEIINKKNKKGVQLKPNQIRNHMFLFVNCQIVNPAFTSQTKEQLTTKSSQFGSRCSVSEKFLKDIAKTDVVTNIMHFAQQKADLVLKKSDGNKRSRMNNAKLTDANKAGTKDGWKCTLILTEGDSASSLALAGRAVLDPDYIGVFPLRGKLLNVRDASIEQISKNTEIQNIKKFLGLQHKKEYTDTKGLRYGHLMIMTDQDHDGSHIKGLLINFFEAQFPSLLQMPDFLRVFITPIVKVWKGDPKHPKHPQSFFTMPEYEEWKRQHSHEKGWEHKYYKGLGTSTNQDAEVYFRDLDQHLKEFDALQTREREFIDLAFSKKKADARKKWLHDFVPGTYLDMAAKRITYDDFINKELILFSMADNLRSIPSVVDGLKPSQRKVMYTCFKKNIRRDVKVVELAGTVSGLTNYAYGDTSLQQTIVGLAQDFVGSNNINLLEPSGNFGSRRLGGQDAASARYIYTRLSPFARRVCHPADEPLLKHEIEDGEKIEPQWFVPVVPLILLNGADGIGTGWSTQIPNYKPDDIVENLKRRMNGSSKEDMLPMSPWFRNFSGPVENMGSDRYKFSGVVTQKSANEVEVTELPIRLWTQDFKDRLEDIIKAEKGPSIIKDYVDYNTDKKVHFIIKMDDKHMGESLERGLEETFKLNKTMGTTNLVAFDHQGRIQKYETALDMMEEFYHIRLQFYEQRKQYLLDEMNRELERFTNQARFVKMIIDGKLVVYKKKKAVLIAELKKLGFKPFPKNVEAEKAGEREPALEDEDVDDDVPDAHSYDYLLGMAIWSLTQERVDRLLKQIGDKEMEIDELIKLTPKDLWNRDLDDFLNEWHKVLKEEKDTANKFRRMGRRKSDKLGIGAKPGKGGKRKKDDDDSEEEFVLSKPAKKAAPKARDNLMTYFSTHATDRKTDAPTAKIKEDDVELDAALGQAAKPKSVSATATLQARHARAATSKPKAYLLDDSDEEEEDRDFDVSHMVKGIGDASDTRKSLFSASAQRPTSSNGLAASITKPRSRPIVDLSDDDETDYTKLVPQGSPQRPAARTANETILSEDGDEDDLDSFAALGTKSKGSKSNGIKPIGLKTNSAKAPSLKASSSKAAAPSKSTVGKASAIAKKAMTSAAVKSAAPPKTDKPVTLSPAAKAYASKQSKASGTKAAVAGKKKASVAADDSMINDLLSDDSQSSPPKPVTRPGRKAAAAKTKYIESDDESDVEMEDSFVVDDDSD